MHNTLAITRSIRQTFVGLLELHSLTELNHIPPKFNNNIIWNIAHTISVQERLIYGLSGLRWKAPKELVKAYSMGTKPEGDVDQKFIDFLKTELLESVDRVDASYSAGEFIEFQEYITLTGPVLRNVDDAIQFDLMHVGLHLGYTMSIRKQL